MSSANQTTSTQVMTGAYIYAFLRAESVRDFVPGQLCGIDNEPVSLVVQDDLAAAVSATSAKKIRPQRKNLAAHQEIVTVLARNYDMLPVAFGLIADDTQQIARLMISHQSVLNEQIERVAGHVEMGVGLRWSVPNIIQYFVDRHEPLSQARQLIASGQASRDDQIALGQMFEKLLNEERQQCTAKFTELLQPLCKELDNQPPREESECMRLACLIRRDAEELFNEAIYKAASQFGEEFTVNFNGPWPPYSFVQLTLGLE